MAAMEAARVDLDPSAAATGTVRVAAFATAVRQSLLPVVRTLARTRPEVRLQIHEHEPDEELVLLGADDIDLALTTSALGKSAWSPGVPADKDNHPPGPHWPYSTASTTPTGSSTRATPPTKTSFAP